MNQGDFVIVKSTRRLGQIFEIYDDLYLVDYVDQELVPIRDQYVYCLDEDIENSTGMDLLNHVVP